MATFDDILEEAGSFGRYQRRLFALLCLLSIPFSGVYVGIVYQGFTPDHWCRDSAVVERRQACGWSPTDGRRLTAPLVNSSGVLQRSSCEQYEVDWNATSLTCDTQELNLTDVPVTTCKDGWEFDYEGRRSFVTEFNLVCSDAWLVDMYQSTLNAGFLIGSFAFGYFADRFGRRISFLMSNLMNLIGGIVLAVAPNYIAILVVRSIFGFGIKGGWMSAYVLRNDDFPCLLRMVISDYQCWNVIKYIYTSTVLYNFEVLVHYLGTCTYFLLSPNSPDSIYRNRNFIIVKH